MVPNRAKHHTWNKYTSHEKTKVTSSSGIFNTNYTNKQIFHVFLFNIRNYSPKVINIQRREAEFNVILPRVNNFDIKLKKARNICFMIWQQHQTRSGRIEADKTANFGQNTSFLSKN